MQTLYTIEDKQTGGIKTLLHASTYIGTTLVVVVYMSDEYGTHKSTVKRTFMNMVEKQYHDNLRENVVLEGGIVHKRVSDTPLPKSKKIEGKDEGRDRKGRFISKKKK